MRCCKRVNEWESLRNNYINFVLDEPTVCNIQNVYQNRLQIQLYFKLTH